jgi:hypothetical protein
MGKIFYLLRLIFLFFTVINKIINDKLISKNKKIMWLIIIFTIPFLGTIAYLSTNKDK